MKTKISTLALATALSFSTVHADVSFPKDSPQYGQWNTGAGLKGEPVGGQPLQGAMPSVTDFNYQAKYQAAYQSLLWSIPAVAIYRLRGAAHDTIKGDDTTILVWNHTATPRLEAITAIWFGIIPQPHV